MSRTVTYAIYPKDGHKYVLPFTSDYKAEALRTLGRWASNPELSFTWWDAAKMSSEIRNQSKQNERSRR